MKGFTTKDWARSRSQREQYPIQDLHTNNFHQSSTGPHQKQSSKPFGSVFAKKGPAKSPSSASLHSAYSSATLLSTKTSDSKNHPYGMAPAPLPVVSRTNAIDDEEECPVCLEPLSFSFRLPGEKPHIVPECGHALHEACFTAVYGPPPSQRSSVPRKSNLGVCGVCRRPMKVGDGDSGKSNKLAALTGMGEKSHRQMYPGRDTDPMSPSDSTYRSRGNSNANQSDVFDPTRDDPIESSAASTRSHYHSSDHHSSYIVAPSIEVRPEFSSITRSHENSQPLTCIVVIELPGKRGTASVPGQPMPQEPYRPRAGTPNAYPGSPPQSAGTQSAYSPRLPQQPAPRLHNQHSMEGSLSRQPSQLSQGRSPSTRSPRSEKGDPEDCMGWEEPEPTPTDSIIMHNEPNSAFAAITMDLQNRIIDWKGHPLSGLGALQMYDLLSVRRDALVRDFYVYLFKEAIICVVEEKKRSFGRLLSSASGAASSAFTDSVSTGSSNQSKGVLRLKGRIYVRHIKNVTASSAAGEMSLTIDMEDERLDSFILIFKERSSLETWKTNIQNLVNMFQSQSGRPRPQQDQPKLDIEEFGGSAKAARMLSGSTTTTASGADSLLNGSARSMSSSTSHGSIAHRHHQVSQNNKLSPLGEEDDEMSPYSETGFVTPHMSAGPSNSLPPLPHPPLDLILVISVPPPTAVPSTAALKVRVIKATLDFILHSLGPKDRLSLCTFEVGLGGTVRKTPFLSAGKPQSRARLARFIEGTGVRKEDSSDDEFAVRGPKDEKTDVVTAVNHGLDVVLQRKSRNPVSGLILVSDAADSTRRAQMDLVLARAEAANVPIHSFGYGRAHDPASLWLMSNHTSGTYTFVRDWYDLRDCIAGCVGGMMSMGLNNMRLHLKIVDGNRFKIRKVSGGPSSILASDGHDVDIDVGELHYGERKEMLIELELDNTDAHRMQQGMGHNGRALSATDQYVASMGLDSLSLGDSPDIMDGMIDRMIDEVPVFEVDGSYFDPAAAKQVSRLAHPVLLTVTIMPPGQMRQSSNNSDPVIVRRRMELLASDMVTRALVLVSRKNLIQANKILGETKRILNTVLNAISKSLPPPSNNGSTVRNRKEILTLGAVRAMQAILQDLQVLSEALEENVDLFGHDQRNFGAQQAMILRDQKSWSGRSATERLFWTIDSAIELTARSTDWVTGD